MRTLLCLALLPLLVAASAAAGPKHRAKPNYKAAKRLFADGMTLFEHEEYLRAAEKFQAAFEITKDPVVLFNVGEAYARADRPKQAIRAYEGYLGGNPSPRERAQVEGKIADLKRKLAWGGAQPQAPSPRAAPVPSVAPKPVEVEPAPPMPPPLALTPPPPTRTQPVAPTDQGSSFLTIAAWTGVGLTAALLTTASLMALAAHSRENDIERRQEFRDPTTGQPLEWNTGGTASDFKTLQDEGQTYRDLSVLFFALSGAAAGATVTLFIVRGMHHEEHAVAPPLGLPLHAAAGPGHASVDLEWKF